MAKKSSGTKAPKKASSGSGKMPPKAKAVGGEKCTGKSAARQF